MVKVYVIGHYASDSHKLWDVIENRSYFTDADAALACVRDAVIAHLCAEGRDVRFLSLYGAEDFKKWMDDNHPDVWYPSTAAELDPFDGAFQTFLEDSDDNCCWFVVVDAP